MSSSPFSTTGGGGDDGGDSDAQAGDTDTGGTRLRDRARERAAAIRDRLRQRGGGEGGSDDEPQRDGTETDDGGDDTRARADRQPDLSTQSERRTARQQAEVGDIGAQTQRASQTRNLSTTGVGTTGTQRQRQRAVTPRASQSQSLSTTTLGASEARTQTADAASGTQRGGGSVTVGETLPPGVGLAATVGATEAERRFDIDVGTDVLTSEVAERPESGGDPIFTDRQRARQAGSRPEARFLDRTFGGFDDRVRRVESELFGQGTGTEEQFLREQTGDVSPTQTAGALLPFAVAEPTPAGEAAVLGLATVGGVAALTGGERAESPFTQGEISVPEESPSERAEIEIPAESVNMGGEISVPERRASVTPPEIATPAEPVDTSGELGIPTEPTGQADPTTIRTAPELVGQQEPEEAEEDEDDEIGPPDDPFLESDRRLFDPRRTFGEQESIVSEVDPTESGLGESAEDIGEGIAGGGTGFQPARGETVQENFQQFLEEQRARQEEAQQREVLQEESRTRIREQFGTAIPGADGAAISVLMDQATSPTVGTGTDIAPGLDVGITPRGRLDTGTSLGVDTRQDERADTRERADTMTGTQPTQDFTEQLQDATEAASETTPEFERLTPGETATETTPATATPPGFSLGFPPENRVARPPAFGPPTRAPPSLRGDLPDLDAGGRDRDEFDIFPTERRFVAPILGPGQLFFGGNGGNGS